MKRKEQLRVLSLGAGVQSSTVLLMSCVGELPKLDAAIFADTGWEPEAVYRHLTWLEDVAKGHGIPVHRVSAGNIKEDALRSQVRGKAEEGQRWASMPYRTVGPNGEIGMIKRQCTTEYKIQPIETFIKRTLLGIPKYGHVKIGAVEQWFGISAEEQRRVRMSRTHWKTHWYPLVDKAVTRHLCLVWMEEHGFPEPPRSACIGCPFRSNTEWRWLRNEEAQSFQDACDFDDAIRHCRGMRGEMFIHQKGIPLRTVDLDSDIDKGQMLLWDNECLGMCGV